jgi:hypothetical protein
VLDSRRNLVTGGVREADIQDATVVC